jgi:hypothetical protein
MSCSLFSKTENLVRYCTLFYIYKTRNIPFCASLSIYSSCWTNWETSLSVKTYRAANDEKNIHAIWVSLCVWRRRLCCGWCHVTCSSKDGEINLLGLTFICEVWTERTKYLPQKIGISFKVMMQTKSRNPCFLRVFCVEKLRHILNFNIHVSVHRNMNQ